jgi:FkbM family methyltransferase
MSFLQLLDRTPAFHHLVRLLRVREMTAWYLRLLPRERILPKTGARYRCRYLESILLADEIFNRNVYLNAIDPEKITTFADIGCNVGYFPVLLTELTGRRDLQGLMIDANPEMIAETEWHLRANSLSHVQPVSGLVGAEGDGETVDFYLLPSNLGSSQFAVYEPGKPRKGNWKKIAVPRLNLEEAWLQACGNVRCNVLKIDIEGSERELLKSEQAFLARVDTVIVEWHKWIIPRASVDVLLGQQGFVLIEVLEDIEQTGIAWYGRR